MQHYNIEFKIGQRFTYPTKDQCVQIANILKKAGFDIKYGISVTGNYYVEIKDPFEGVEME